MERGSTDRTNQQTVSHLIKHIEFSDILYSVLQAGQSVLPRRTPECTLFTLYKSKPCDWAVNAQQDSAQYDADQTSFTCMYHFKYVTMDLE